MEMLSNRELSLYIWVIVLFLFILFFPKTRTSLKKLIITFSHWKLLIPFVCMTIYIMTCVYGLSILGLWKTHQIKNTIIWYFTVGIVVYFNALDIAKNPHYVKKWIRDNLKGIILLQFIFSFYTFNFIIEFISVPILFAIGAMQGIADGKKDYKRVIQFLDFLVILYLILILGLTIYKLTTSFNEFVQIKTVYDFAIPILLSILILPFICFLSLFSNYEQAFLNFERHIKDIQLMRHAILISLVKFNLRSKLLLRWSSNLFAEKISSNTDIVQSIHNFYYLLATEKNPPPISPDLGWSPYSAIKFLNSEGITTGNYRHSNDNEWIACSPIIDINKGDGFLSNTISYYIEGNSRIAKNLLLVLNIFDLKSSKAAIKKFLQSVKTLYVTALGKEFPLDLEKAILRRKNFEAVINTFKIALKRNNTPNNKAYYLEFTIGKIYGI